jgi:K+-sensing histidine kinase KdpD
MELETDFAPAVRSSKNQILDECELVVTQKFFTDLFGAISGICAIINQNRQIVYANNDFLQMLGLASLEPVLGKRPGEVISCVHSNKKSGGCGTSIACSCCGAVHAILESQKTGRKSTKETRITTYVDGKLKSLDLNVTSSPVTLSGQNFYAFMLQDISAEKRRSALERIFFHDMLNSAGGLYGLLSLLKDGSAHDSDRELINLSEEASRDIIEEIVLQKQVRSAEIGDLNIKIESVNSIEILNSSIGKICSHEAGKNKHIVLSENTQALDFETDRGLLQRVIINLLKNALEATPEQGKVLVGVENLNTRLRFWVRNDGVLPMDVQMQLFQRSFSTKGLGRGIGTYCVRLLTENYLGGKVSFISNETDGTVFNIELNKIFPADLR